MGGAIGVVVYGRGCFAADGEVLILAVNVVSLIGGDDNGDRLIIYLGKEGRTLPLASGEAIAAVAGVGSCLIGLRPIGLCRIRRRRVSRMCCCG